MDNASIKKLDADLWESADLLRAGSKLTSNQYCMPVLGLLFLRYAYEEYKNMNVRIELLEILAEAEDDVRNVRVAPASETFGDLRKMLQEG